AGGRVEREALRTLLEAAAQLGRQRLALLGRHHVEAEGDTLDTRHVLQRLGDLLLERTPQRTTRNRQRDRDAHVAAVDLEGAHHVELRHRLAQLRIDDAFERLHDQIAIRIAHPSEPSFSNFFAAGARGRGSSSTGTKRSPCSSMRRSASSVPKSRGRMPGVSSSQRNGVDTGAPGLGRTEYTDAIVLPWPFWRWSTRTPSRFFFSHSVVTLPGCRSSSSREACSAKSYVCPNVDRRVIGATT